MSSWIVRLAVSGTVLAALAAVLPLAEVWTAVRQVSPATWSLAVLAFLAGHVTAAAKWRLLMESAPRMAACLRAHFTGLVANLCLPGVAGGDVLRAAALMRQSGSKESVAVASVADRAIDCAALLTLAAVGAVLSQSASGGRATLSVAAIGLAGAFLAVLVLRFLRGRAGVPVVHRALAAIDWLAAHPTRVARAAVLSVLVQGMFVAVNMWLGRAAGVDVALSGWLLAWPLAKLVALVPISLAGLGIREAALVAFLRPFGAEASRVFAAGLMWEGVLIAGGLVGWSASLAVRREPVAADVRAGSSV